MNIFIYAESEALPLYPSPAREELPSVGTQKVRGMLSALDSEGFSLTFVRLSYKVITVF